jgi:transposase
MLRIRRRRRRRRRGRRRHQEIFVNFYEIKRWINKDKK